jgi:NitT/TauT family transport system ATP-binding protein
VGKTTMANILAGILRADEGEVVGAEGKEFSFVFQEDRLLEWDSAVENLLFVKNDSERAIELLASAGLLDSANKKTAELSGGMKRRVCICRALIADYDVLILDEPFKGLDVEIKNMIMEMVKSYSHGIVICITHDMSEAEFFGGEIVNL